MIMRALSFLLIFVVLAPMLVAQGTPADDRIYDAVRQKLANDPDVKGAGLDVSVKAGVVTLRGRCTTRKRKKKPRSLPRE